MKGYSTQSPHTALCNCCHQGGAASLVCRVHRCIMGKEKLNAVNLTRKRCSVKRSPAEKPRHQNTDPPATPRPSPPPSAYLPFESLQPVMSEPMASSSSAAHDS